METLNLTLTRFWFEMIANGLKTEEYREIKPYWIKRLCVRSGCNVEACDHVESACFVSRYDKIRFTNGYGKDRPTMLVELGGIRKGVGYALWGAPEEKVFILSLGKILEISNYSQKGLNDEIDDPITEETAKRIEDIISQKIC